MSSAIIRDPAQRFRFSRELRLLTAKDFNEVFGYRRTLNTAAFRVHYAPGEQQHVRLGLALAKRVIPHAADRNRIKRMLREAFRLAQHALPPLDVVVRIQPAARTMDTPDLKADLELLMTRVQTLLAQYPAVVP